MVKKKTSYIDRKHKNDVNKKALIWVISSFAVIVVILAVLLILDL